MSEGLLPCPFCGNPHPEIASGDSIICNGVGGATCWASNLFEMWNTRAPAPRLTWTTGRPTVPGWYWARHPFIVDMVLVSVGQEHIDRNEFKPGSQWAGPIPEPEPAPETLA